MKFEDGTEVTSADVKYAVLRSTDKATFPNGPAYFEGSSTCRSGYKGPYKSPNMNTDSAIETPDEYTIVFHIKAAVRRLRLPRAAAADRCRCPKAKDTGAKYRNTIVSTGPYKFADLQPGKSFNLVRNDQWDPATDPNRKALPDASRSALNVNADDIDNRLHQRRPRRRRRGTGVQPAAQSRVLQDPALKANADNPLTPRLWYTSINPTVTPFDNIDCRKAVQYAMDQTGYQTAYGGQFAGGDLATTIMPPIIPGYQISTCTRTAQDHKGDLDAAKKSLDKPAASRTASRPTSPTGPSGPKEKATAEAFQQALSRVGIKLTLKPYPQGDYFAQYAGNPPFVVKNKLGLARRTAGVPTGLMASASCPRSSTRGSSGRPAGPPTPASASPRSTRCSTRRCRARRGQAQPDVGRDRQAGHGGGRHLPGRVRQGSAGPAEECHQRVRHRRVRQYDYLGMGAAEVATSK